MDALISVNRMIKRLEEWNTNDDRDKALYNFAMNRVFEQPTVEAKPVEWIPCSEKLPEDEETKLVTLSDGKVEGAFWNERNWWCMGDSINLETRTEDVIAWMELPAPYNEERGGKNE